MWLRAITLATFSMWSTKALSAPPAAVAYGFETRTQVFEGVFTLHPPAASNGTTIKIERRHIGASDCNPCMLISDPPAFVSVDRVVKGEPGHPLHDAMEQSEPGAPPPPDGARVRVFSQGRFWTIVCPLDVTAPSPLSCERSNQQLAAWQAVQEQIRTATDRGDVDALLHLAETLAKTDPYSAVHALYGAMDHGALASAGPRAAEILVAQASYTEAIAVLDRVIAAQAAAANADLVARREFVRAISGRHFEASRVDFSHSTLMDVHLGPAILRDRSIDGVDWRDVHLDHVDFSGLRSTGFKIDSDSLDHTSFLDHVSFHGASVAVAPTLADGGGRAGRALAVGPGWDGKSPAPTFRDVVNNAQGTAITAFALQLTRPTFSIHASITDSDFTNASLPYAEINGSRGGFVRMREPATQRTRFDGSDLKAAGIGGYLEHVSFKGANLDWADFSTATLDDVSFEGASLAGAEFAVIHLRNVDFSHAKRWQPDLTIEGVAHRLDKKSIIDPILGLRFDPETFGRSTYDCATKWPAGFDPTLYGLVPTQASCVPRQSLDFDGLNLNGLDINQGQDLSGASFRGANVRVFCQRGSLKSADFTNAQISGSAASCDLTHALFDRATISASLFGAKLDDVRFVDATINVDVIASFGFGGFSIQKPPDPSSRTFTDLPGATFLRSRIVCTGTRIDPSNEDRLRAAFQNLQARGLTIDATCPSVQPPSSIQPRKQ